MHLRRLGSQTFRPPDRTLRERTFGVVAAPPSTAESAEVGMQTRLSPIPMGNSRCTEPSGKQVRPSGVAHRSALMIPMDERAAESLLNLAERAGPGLKGLDAKALFGELEQQYADLLAAMQWFIDQGRTDECLRLATSLAPFWMATKRLEEGSAWFDRTLGSPGGEDAHRGRASLPGGHAGLLDGCRRPRVHAPWPGLRDRPPAWRSHDHGAGLDGFGANRAPIGLKHG